MRERGRGEEGGGKKFPIPPVPNPSVALLALGGQRSWAKKAASAFSCRAFYFEGGEGEGGKFECLQLPGGGQIVSLKAQDELALSHLLLSLLPEEADLVVFDPGKIEIKGDLYALSSCYVTAAGSREVLKNFSLLKRAGKKAIDLSWTKGEEWRERVASSLFSKIPAFFEVETGSLDPSSLLLAGWAREKFGLPTKFRQSPSYSSSVSKVVFGAPGWQVCIKEAQGGGAFEIQDGQRSFKAPKRAWGTEDFLIRQMELLPPDPLYFKSLDFEALGAKDVG